jgi:hypothetical protein
MKNSIYLVVIISLTAIFSCGSNNEPQDFTPPLHPQLFSLEGYTYSFPEYYLVGDTGISTVVPTAGFSNHMEVILLEEELPEISELFFIREISLNSETECSVLILDATDNSTTLSEGLPYEIIDNELFIWNADMTQSIPFEYNSELTQLTFCETVFANTYRDEINDRIIYSGFDFNACFLFDQSNIPLSYRENAFTILTPLDTLGYIQIERNFILQ